MTRRLYKEDPLTPAEREEFEEDLIAFCDRELDLLGDIRGLDVLYAGGSSPLWVEGLSERVGEGGNVTAIDLDVERVEEARLSLVEAELPAPVNVLAADVFEIPSGPLSFDIVYSSGLFHELEVGEKCAKEALVALRSAARPGGRVATSDFVASEPAAQLEDEELEAALMREAYGKERYRIWPPERLVRMHESLLAGVRWLVSPPSKIRHLEKLVLAEEEPAELASLPPATASSFRERRQALRDRISSEGYTRPATLYVEGVVPDG